ncbi:MAG: NAD(P)-dependent oxidoreductase [Verrucomicrobiota bacterium]
MKDVFFFEAFEEERRLLEEFAAEGMDCGYTCATIQESGIIEVPARVISIRTQSGIPLHWLEEIDGILARATGYDHLTKLACIAPGKQYGYLPFYCPRSVAEQALLMWMFLMRKLKLQQQQFVKFDRDGLTGRECSQKCLVVAGVGNIGREVLRVGRGLDMNVLGVDIVQRHEDVEYVSLDEGLARADVIVCSMNLTAENDRYFRYDVLRKAEKQPLFINVARGEFSPAADMARLLDEGRLSGVGMDVFEDEKKVAQAFRTGRQHNLKTVETLASLRNRPDVILTPHNAFNTREAVNRKAKQSIEQLRHFFRTGAFKWPIP